MSLAVASQEHTARRRLADARARGALAAFIGRLELYCTQPACPVREVGLRVKEFAGPTPTRLTCPACRHPLKLHWVRTREEHLDVLEQTEESSTNARGGLSGIVKSREDH